MLLCSLNEFPNKYFEKYVDYQLLFNQEMLWKVFILHLRYNTEPLIYVHFKNEQKYGD